MIHFQIAELSHAKDIALLVNSAYRGDGSKVGWTTEADLLGGQRTDELSIGDILNLPENFILLAFSEDSQLKPQLIGCVHLKIESKAVLYFGMLTVSPEAQSRGLGKLLIEEIEKKARVLEIKKIRISVIDQRPELIAFYQRRGFVASGLSEPFPSHDPLFGIPKVPGLKLLEYIKNL